VKLLDFGIAKVLEKEPEGEAVTLPGGHALTPRYASPEQIRGEPVSTATDIFSLGVVLYELLTGTRPYRTEGLSSREIERLVLDEEPRRASLAAREAGALSGRAAGARALSNRLRGDLDNILLTAMRKEPERRYGSVDQLAEDIRRHLAGYPISARPDSARIRVEKFVRRNPWLVASVAALILVLGAATATSLALLVRARAARHDADVQRASAEEVARFLQDMLAGANPLESSRKDVTVREILDHAASQVSENAPGTPEVAAAVHATLGRTYRALAENERARDHLRAALDLHRAPGSSGASAAMAAMATTRNLAGVYLELDLPDSAEIVLTQAMSECEEVLAADPLERGRCEGMLALVRQSKGEWDAAEAMFRTALETTRRGEDPAGEAVGARLNDLGVLLVRQGKYEEAEAHLRESLEISRTVQGPRSYETAQIAQNLGWVLSSAGRPREAEPPLREALDIYSGIVDEDHPLATSARMNLALVLQQSGRGAEAVPMLRRVLEADRRRYGPEHVRVATDLANLALALGEEGELAESLRLYAEARSLYEKALGPEHPWVAISLYSESVMRRRAGDSAGAERLARRCLAIRREALRADHPDLVKTLRLLGEILVERGAVAEGEALLEEAAETAPPEAASAPG
jgi:serine/threonine-protein kinase